MEIYFVDVSSFDRFLLQFHHEEWYRPQVKNFILLTFFDGAQVFVAVSGFSSRVHPFIPSNSYDSKCNPADEGFLPIMVGIGHKKSFLLFLRVKHKKCSALFGSGPEMDQTFTPTPKERSGYQMGCFFEKNPNSL